MTFYILTVAGAIVSSQPYIRKRKKHVLLRSVSLGMGFGGVDVLITYLTYNVFLRTYPLCKQRSISADL